VFLTKGFDGVTDGAAQRARERRHAMRGVEIEQEGYCSARLAAHFVEQPAGTTTNSEEGARCWNFLGALDSELGGQGGRGLGHGRRRLAAVAVWWGRWGGNGAAVRHRDAARRRTAVEEMGLVLARRESSAPWLLAGAGARQQKRGGSAYSWAASMEKKPLRIEVVEQEMVAGFLLPENRGRASVAGALGRRGWSFGRRPWKGGSSCWQPRTRREGSDQGESRGRREVKLQEVAPWGRSWAAMELLLASREEDADLRWKKGMARHGRKKRRPAAARGRKQEERVAAREIRGVGMKKWHKCKGRDPYL
jgi:hypothetical protein